jgi:hypothetical protein
MRVQTDIYKTEVIERAQESARIQAEQAEAKLRALERVQTSAPDDAQTQFRQEFGALDAHQRGTWGERVVIGEATKAGHAILAEHFDTPTGRGFDCISYDLTNKQVHIWEVKNWGQDTHAVDSKDVTAWQDQNKYGNPRDGYKDNWKDVLGSVPEGPAQDAIRQAVNEGRVVFHLRLGPDTRLTPQLQQELEKANVPGASYDWRRYSYDEMLKAGSGM